MPEGTAVQCAYLQTNWLDDTAGINTATVTTSQTSGFGDYSNTATTICYPYWTYPVYHYVERRPIRLKLSEVEHLRDRAKHDAKLRRILKKFTDYIEIAVDFD